MERLKPYYVRESEHENAIKLYKINLRLSEAFYTSLSVFEITLRNAIHNSCKVYFGDNFWFINHLPVELATKVIEIKNKIVASHKAPTADRIVSELTFGFWTSLFNRKYAYLLWKPLYQIFIHAPHILLQRAIISPKLNSIRDFRNRVYHYEPICWNLNALQQKHNLIIELLYWLDSGAVQWIADIDRAPGLLREILENE